MGHRSPTPSKLEPSSTIASQLTNAMVVWNSWSSFRG
jgi:hypothetical protein